MTPWLRRVPAVVFVLGVAIVLRCALLLAWFAFDGDPRTLHNPDTATYLAPAESLLSAGTFERNASPEIIRGPGYPLFLSLGLVGGHLEGITIALQIVISVATVYLIYRLSLLIDPRREVALTAAVLYAVEPLSVMYCCFLLSETLFTFLFVATLFCIVRFVRDRAPGALVLAAVLLIASAFVRPVSYYLPVVVGGILFLTSLGRLKWYRAAALASGFLAVCAIPLGAWQWRNWQRAEYPGFSAIIESDMYFFLQAQVIAAIENRSLGAVQADLGMHQRDDVVRQHPTWQNASDGKLHSLMGSQARDVILAHPFLYARLHLRNIATLLVAAGSADLMHLTNHLGAGAPAPGDPAREESIVGRVLNDGRARIVTAMLLSALAALYVVAAAIGCWQPMPERLRWTLLVLGGYFWAVSCLPQPPARLRHPLMPIVCLLAAQGFAFVLPHARRTLAKLAPGNRLDSMGVQARLPSALAKAPSH